jgi:hypothetical protein
LEDGTSSEGIPEGSRLTAIQETATEAWETAERKTEKRNLARKDTEAGTRVRSAATTALFRREGKPLVLLQLNCRSIYNKALDFWNLVDTYNPVVVIGTESWLREEISNAEVFRSDFTTFRRDRRGRGGGVFVCVKNCIACAELCVDENYEMIAVEVKGADPKYTWEIVGIYRAPYEDLRVIERLEARTRYLGNSIKRSIIGSDLKLPQADWKGMAEGTDETQIFLHRLVWDDGYTQLVESPT